MTCALALLALLASQPAADPVFIPYSDARPILEAMRDALPDAFKSADAAARESLWPGWVQGRDREIRARLAQGAEDSIAHLMLFGTTFTSAPRATLADLAGLSKSADQSALATRLAMRIRDLAQALAHADDNERLAFARRLLAAKGLDPDGAVGHGRLESYLYENLKRVLREDQGYAKALAEARGLDPTNEFAARSSLFRERGLSSDTSLLPNMALEEALAALAQKGLLGREAVKRVAIVGPGLDFTDKRDGYDFYPQQTIQPFAIADSLLRLGLAPKDGLRLVTFDLSPQVNDHVAQAVAGARHGRGYVVQLPRDAKAPWTPAALRYWERFGDQIGAPATPVPVPSGLGDVKTRAIRIRPELVARLEASDLDVVLQRPGAGERFDLVIATNILVYYDPFEQSLALTNVAAMLRPGGFLLSNNALVELPGSRMRSVGYSSTAYSDLPTDGDRIVWYRRLIE